MRDGPLIVDAAERPSRRVTRLHRRAASIILGRFGSRYVPSAIHSLLEECGAFQAVHEFLLECGLTFEELVRDDDARHFLAEVVEILAETDALRIEAELSDAPLVSAIRRAAATRDLAEVERWADRLRRIASIARDLRMRRVIFPSFTSDFQPRALEAIEWWQDLSDETIEEIYEASIAYEELQRRYDAACAHFVRLAAAARGIFASARQEKMLAWFLERFETAQEEAREGATVPAEAIEGIEALAAELRTIVDEMSGGAFREGDPASGSRREESRESELGGWLETLELGRDDLDRTKVKKAFRRLAMEYHPDRLSRKPEAERRRAEDRMKEVNAAYAGLMKTLDRRTAATH